MTKSELIAKIAEKAQLTDKQAKDAVDAIQVEITEALKGGETVQAPESSWPSQMPRTFQ